MAFSTLSALLRTELWRAPGVGSVAIIIAIAVNLQSFSSSSLASKF